MTRSAPRQFSARFWQLREELLAQYFQIVSSGYAVHVHDPPAAQKAGRKKQNPSLNLLDAFLQRAEQVLGFLDDLTVPFTNNLAERDLRMIKVQQKISGTFRSSEGISAFCTIRKLPRDDAQARPSFAGSIAGDLCWFSFSHRLGTGHLSSYKESCNIIDSAIYEKDGTYYLFVKSDSNPITIILLKSDSVTGPFTQIYAFDEEIAKVAPGQYEAPTAIEVEDGRWCLFLDFYGTTRDEQGYVPFVSQNISTDKFVRSDEAFSFPYRFKHGTILTLTPAEYDRVKHAYH